MKVFIVVVLFFVLLFQEYSCAQKYRDGDIVFHNSKSAQSEAIRLATHSEYSHVGIIFKKENAFWVLEAVQPVRWTRMESWINRGVGARFVVKRLRNSNHYLGPSNIEKLRKAGTPFVGKSYDFYFGWSDKRIYCSELVWKIYKRALGIELGEPQKLKDFDLSHPGVKRKLLERYGKSIPLDELVVSPEAIFSCDKLETVFKQ